MLAQGLELFWDAFWTLSWGRQIAVGFGVVAEQPITYSDISAFGRDQPGLEPGEPGFDLLVRLIRAMDREFIATMAERRKADAEAKKGQQQRDAARSRLILPGGDA